MRAARYHGPGPGLILDTVPVPVPGPGEALVRVLAAGLCHTELQFLEGTLNLGVAPLTLGHEIAGVVEAIGEAGKDADDSLRPGDRVVVYYLAPCGECVWCADGQEQICPNMGPQIGFSGDGGFAEYVRVPTQNLLPIPAGLDAEVAATLGCAAATALHAVRAVADVRAGETVLVYGVGAVGLALIQLARVAGARVLAVGRTSAKLALARDLGAEATFSPLAGDVVAEVMRLTRSAGADVVFETVGGAETMANSIALLRRRGRLIFVGYGADRFTVNPLHLVLKELQVRGAVGNTRAELADTLHRAASGQLRAIVAKTLPLADVNEALDRLRGGHVVGRLVIDPARAGRASSEAAPEGAAPESSGVTVGRAAHGSVEASRRAVGGIIEKAPRDASSVPTGSREARRPNIDGPADVAASRPFEAELLAMIDRGVDAPKDDAEFDDLARRLFAYQFERNAPYRTFCERRRKTPETVTRWTEIPAIPISAFKHVVLACEGTEGAREFNSSGTTRPEYKSRHFHPSLAVYDRNASINFAAHLLPDGRRLPMLVLFPAPDEMPNSSLAHWLALQARHHASDGGRWFVSTAGLDADGLTDALRDAERVDQPICLLAASFSLVHFLEYCAERQVAFRLPPGSRLMDTGGYKGRSRELTKIELYDAISATLGLAANDIVNMYGMTEHSTQFLDAMLRNNVRGVQAPRYKTVPPWARTRVLDPNTLQPVPRGEPGLLCHYDLANRASVLAVLSEDVGYELDEGFEVIGRADSVEARGCSISVDELIGAARV